MRGRYWAAILTGCLTLALVGAASAGQGSRVVSRGDPFAACVGVGTDNFGGVNYPDTEVEPWVAANAANPRNVVGVFAEAGLASLVFDNRSFGVSDGEPRHEMDPWQQVSDYRAAITYAGTGVLLDPRCEPRAA
jgi:hypothetical protein